MGKSSEELAAEIAATKTNEIAKTPPQDEGAQAPAAPAAPADTGSTE